MSWTPERVQMLERIAAEAGFDRAGVAPAHAAHEPGGLGTAERFADWIEAGHAGEMEYLKRRSGSGALLRRSAREAMPWARSVVVCAMSYNAAAPRSIDPAPADKGWIARYAWSGDPAGRPVDYHDDMLARLRVVEAALRAELICETRCYVDTGPLLERDFASRAGVGWIGKNTCVLNQELGSWLLLGVIVCSLEPPPAAQLAITPDRCGSCTRCLDACPTDALIAPRQMDASLCIAYLTIEKKGSIAEPLRAKMGRQVFGCDICQDVCPWNRRAPVIEHLGLQIRAELVNPSLASLGAMQQEDFRAAFKGSPLERTKHTRVQRNVAIAMGNSGQREFIPRLTQWAAGPDTVLAEAAVWALQRLAGASASIERSRSEEPHGSTV